MINIIGYLIKSCLVNVERILEVDTCVVGWELFLTFNCWIGDDLIVGDLSTKSSTYSSVSTLESLFIVSTAFVGRTFQWSRCSSAVKVENTQHDYFFSALPLSYLTSETCLCFHSSLSSSLCLVAILNSFGNFATWI